MTRRIRQLLEKYNLVPKQGISLAAATVRGLILTISHKGKSERLYPQVLETLVYAVLTGSYLNRQAAKCGFSRRNGWHHLANSCVHRLAESL